MGRSWKIKMDRGVPLNILERAPNDSERAGKICGKIVWHMPCKRRDQGNYHSGNKVFTDEQENELIAYLMRAADVYFGLCPHEVRDVAYQLAVKYGCRHPKSWDESSKAGADWFSAYMKRNPTLSLRSFSERLMKS
ncbi:hypothetical protein N1851_022872 [Merluccius polli]|uniref:HTH CENPB-type domain-containing protein n=1 Tax=Merluccius polli TaxID=89951 RepID=A0AA47MH43_MERPO|nr:hypothetical protein N1851_022872 [Merluccius polli]